MNEILPLEDSAGSGNGRELQLRCYNSTTGAQYPQVDCPVRALALCLFVSRAVEEAPEARASSSECLVRIQSATASCIKNLLGTLMA